MLNEPAQRAPPGQWGRVVCEWSEVKQFCARAEARTGEELQSAIAAALATVTAHDALNWFVSCGYSFKFALKPKRAREFLARLRLKTGV